MSDNDDVVSDQLKNLLEGRQYPGDCGCPVDKKPDWLDLERFHRGRKLFHKFPYSVMTGIGVGVYWMSQLPSLVEPLMFTGKAATVEKACCRFRTTMYHVYLWYQGDVWNPKDEAHRSVQSVRQLHQCVSRRMNSKDQLKTRLWITQYDMMLTQFSFLACNILFPHRVGLRCSDEDIMSFVHFWTGIGYLLGVEDRFNLGLQANNLQDVRKLVDEIVERVVKPSLANPRPDFDGQLWRGARAYRLEADILGDHGSLMHFTFDMIGVPVPKNVGSWLTPVCRAGRWVLVACVNAPILGRAINAYSVYIYRKVSSRHLGVGQQASVKMADLSSVLRAAFQYVFLKWSRTVWPENV